MNPIRIPTTAGLRTVLPVDTFTLTINGMRFHFAVHPGIGFMQPPVVSEYSTGRAVAQLKSRCAGDYAREEAVAAMTAKRHSMGDASAAIRMLDVMGRSPRLNTWVEQPS
jgi:hypothetical protein